VQRDGPDRIGGVAPPCFLQRDECSRYQEPERVHAALTSVVMQAADAETWDVTTARGRDGYFYPAFMEDWSAQGAVNPWERGFRPGYGRGTAWFFPWLFLYEAMSWRSTGQ
jgi:hypothetical protein